MISISFSSLAIELELTCCKTDRFDNSKLNSKLNNKFDNKFDSNKLKDRFKYDKNDIENE